MQTIIRLDLKDLKEIVAEKYNCDPKDIGVQIKEAVRDGIYCESENVIFEVTQKG